MSLSAPLPTISVVTPSFNRMEYLADAMDSVLEQQYPKLEYVVVDGRSTDGSAELIERRGDKLAWWTSEPDGGAWEAINKGFARTSGDVMGWLGSDDLLMPWSLSVIGEVFATFPEIEWLTSMFPTAADVRGRPVNSYYLEALSREDFFAGATLPFAGWPAAGFVQQEATYWRRSLWERAGGQLKESLRLAADFELWARFHQSGATLYGVPVPLAAFRQHGNQKSGIDFQGYVAEARSILIQHGGQPPTVPLPRRMLRRVLPRRVRERVGSALDGLLSVPAYPNRRGRHVVEHDKQHQSWKIELRS
jgi:GT2 family glycosyltransferase